MLLEGEQKGQLVEIKLDAQFCDRFLKELLTRQAQGEAKKKQLAKCNEELAKAEKKLSTQMKTRERRRIKVCV